MKEIAAETNGGIHAPNAFLTTKLSGWLSVCDENGENIYMLIVLRSEILAHRFY